MTAGGYSHPAGWIAICILWQCLCWLSATGSIIDHRPRHIQGKKELFVLDVDAGADDALAIMMMTSKLASNESGVEVIAITCVNGNTKLDNVVVNVFKTLKVMGRLDIPVYLGSPKSLLYTPPTDNFFGLDGFGDFYFEGPPNPKNYLQRENAISALIRIVSEHPGQVNLLAIGPLTNVALAMRLQPNFLKNLKRLYVLGGAVNGVGNVKPGVEFNFYMDPTAAQVVLNETTKPICLIPWETAKIRSTVSLAWRKKVLGEMDAPRVKFLNLAERKVISGDDGQWISSDSIAAWAALNRKGIGSTCGGTPWYAYVLTSSGDASGALLVDYANNTKMPANIEVVEEINVRAYKDTLMRSLCER